MPNERLRATLLESGYDERTLADELGLDHKSVQRWITRDVTPRRTAAHRAAKLLGVSASWLWPNLEPDRESASQAEIVTLYPHRSEVPRHLWLDLVTAAQRGSGCTRTRASSFPKTTRSASTSYGARQKAASKYGY